MADAVGMLRILAGVAAAVYAAVLIGQRVRWPSVGVGVGVDADLRAVLALASRFRASGKVEAVRLCQQLLDELLKLPGAETPK